MMNRREALARIGGLIGGGLLASRAAAQTTTSTSTSATVAGNLAGPAPAAGQSFTLAHITDVHLKDEHDAVKWFTKCLHDIQSHPKKPAMIMNTGDSVFDVLKVDRQKADALWKLWNDTLKNELSLPIHHALGNHDVWGLHETAPESVRNDPMYGKKMTLDKFGLENTYYSLNYGDWHFIMLDTIFPDPETRPSGWYAQLGDEQFEWLKQDLQSVGKDRPVGIYSHVPIVQACGLLQIRPNANGAYAFGNHAMIQDARRVIDLFKEYPNVKLCYSGHVHLRDRVEIGEVTYICDGAVSGRWWQGPREFADPGYSVTTFNPDGTFEHEYTGYGWEDTSEDKA